MLRNLNVMTVSPFLTELPEDCAIPQNVLISRFHKSLYNWGKCGGLSYNHGPRLPVVLRFHKNSLTWMGFCNFLVWFNPRTQALQEAQFVEPCAACQAILYIQWSSCKLFYNNVCGLWWGGAHFGNLFCCLASAAQLELRTVSASRMQSNK